MSTSSPPFPSPPVSLAAWNAALAAPNDSAAQAKLAIAYYRGYMGADVHVSGETVTLLECLAEVYVKAFSSLDAARLGEVRDAIQGNAKFIEPGIWEGPNEVAAAHAVLDELLAKGITPTLQELLQVAHDLENVVRPNLRRLVWVLNVVEGDKTGYPEAQLAIGTRRPDEQGSLGHAIKKLTDWKNSGRSATLDATRLKRLHDFISSLDGTFPGSDDIQLDEYRNWIAHRDFFIGPTKVGLGLHPVQPGGPRKVRQKTEITEKRRRLLGLMGIAFASKVLFLSQAEGRAGATRQYPWTGSL